MVQIINLRSVRKAKARAADKARADANRAKHGRTLADRKLAAADADRSERTLDQARREREED